MLKRTWETQKRYLRRAPRSSHQRADLPAVSVTNGCSGIACHTALARKAGMTDAIFGELMAVVGMANQTNRFADGYRLPIDNEFNDE